MPPKLSKIRIGNCFLDLNIWRSSEKENRGQHHYKVIKSGDLLIFLRWACILTLHNDYFKSFPLSSNIQLYPLSPPSLTTDHVLQNDCPSQFTKEKKSKSRDGNSLILPANQNACLTMPHPLPLSLPSIKIGDQPSCLCLGTPLLLGGFLPILSLLLLSWMVYCCLNTKSLPSKTNRPWKPLIPLPITPFSYHFLSSTSWSRWLKKLK